MGLASKAKFETFLRLASKAKFETFLRLTSKAKFETFLRFATEAFETFLWWAGSLRCHLQLVVFFFFFLACDSYGRRIEELFPEVNKGNRSSGTHKHRSFDRKI